MPGLDPGIQGPPERLSVTLDCRVKPGNDKKEKTRMALGTACHHFARWRSRSSSLARSATAASGFSSPVSTACTDLEKACDTRL
jgi:hypothetical protein